MYHNCNKMLIVIEKCQCYTIYIKKNGNLKGEKMKRFSKLLTMALVMLAVITMSLTVKAETKDLSAYISESHEINNMVFELTKAEKAALADYIDKNVDDTTADAIIKDLGSAEKLLKNSGKSDMKEIDPAIIKSAVDIVKRACQKAGLTLSASNSDQTYKITKNSDGTSVITGTYVNKFTTKAVTDTKQDNAKAAKEVTDTKKENVKETKKEETNTTKTNTKTNTTNTTKNEVKKNTNTTDSKKLLYTGYNPVVYVVAVLVIVAIAIVAKKRV